MDQIFFPLTLPFSSVEHFSIIYLRFLFNFNLEVFLPLFFLPLLTETAKEWQGMEIRECKVTCNKKPGLGSNPGCCGKHIASHTWDACFTLHWVPILIFKIFFLITIHWQAFWNALSWPPAQSAGLGGEHYSFCTDKRVKRFRQRIHFILSCWFFGLSNFFMACRHELKWMIIMLCPLFDKYFHILTQVDYKLIVEAFF